jgi:hypothetical protein
MGSGTGYSPATIAIIAVFVAFAIYRNTRPRKLTVATMWMLPILLGGLAAFAIWGSQQMFPAPAWAIVVAVVGGMILGTPLGVLRGRHTDVRATDTPGVMYLHPSLIPFALYLGAFAVRWAIRAMMPPGLTASIVGDGLLVFAMWTIIVSYYEIYKKYRGLEHQAGQI